MTINTIGFGSKFYALVALGRRGPAGFGSPADLPGRSRRKVCPLNLGHFSLIARPPKAVLPGNRPGSGLELVEQSCAGVCMAGKKGAMNGISAVGRAAYTQSSASISGGPAKASSAEESRESAAQEARETRKAAAAPAAGPSLAGVGESVDEMA
jgi:hypothetical protein